MLNFKSKSENQIGYLNCELLKPVSPLFFDDKKKSICILASTSILKILLPERQINKKIYESFEKMIIHLDNDDWILIYILWEFSLIKELGYEIDISDTKNIIKKIIEVNKKFFKIPKFLLNNNKNLTKNDIKEALIFNRSLIMENFILPNRLKFPISRNVLEKYYN